MVHPTSPSLKNTQETTLVLYCFSGWRGWRYKIYQGRGEGIRIEDLDCKACDPECKWVRSKEFERNWKLPNALVFEITGMPYYSSIMHSTDNLRIICIEFLFKQDNYMSAFYHCFLFPAHLTLSYLLPFKYILIT